MTTYEIIGIKQYSFSDSVSGRMITGTKLFCIYEDTIDVDTTGYKCISFNVSQSKIGTYLPQCGDKLHISWADKKNFKVDALEHVV